MGSAVRIMHQVPRPARAGKRGKRPRRAVIQGEQFRDERISAGLSRHAAATFLQVSLRTVGHWETGRCRVPYAAFKLLRICRRGELVDPEWCGFSLVRGRLITPEGHTFEPHELVWQSLLVRRARAFSELLAERGRAGRENGADSDGRAAGTTQEAGERASAVPGSAGRLARRSAGVPGWIHASPAAHFPPKLNEIGLLPSSNRGVRRSGSWRQAEYLRFAGRVAGGVR